MPVLFERTQNAIVIYSELLEPFLNNCKSCPSILYCWVKIALAPKLPFAEVQSSLCDVAKPCPVGTVVDFDIVQVPEDIKPTLNLSTAL